MNNENSIDQIKILEDVYDSIKHSYQELLSNHSLLTKFMLVNGELCTAVEKIRLFREPTVLFVSKTLYHKDANLFVQAYRDMHRLSCKLEVRDMPLAEVMESRMEFLVCDKKTNLDVIPKHWVLEYEEYKSKLLDLAPKAEVLVVLEIGKEVEEKIVLSQSQMKEVFGDLVEDIYRQELELRSRLYKIAGILQELNKKTTSEDRSGRDFVPFG